MELVDIGLGGERRERRGGGWVVGTVGEEAEFGGRGAVFVASVDVL